MISMNVQVLRILLIIFLVAIYLVSVSFLCDRKMSAKAYALWGIFALLLPAFGPFFLIAYRPGKAGGDFWGCIINKAAQKFRKPEFS